MPKPLKVAGEVDSWCTKCRLVLNHRIVSMKNGKAYQVECLTCRTTHLWRAAAPGDKPAAAGTGGRAPRASSSVAPKSTRITPAMRHEQSWEKAIAGRGVNEFKAYNTGGSFREGDLLRHKKFGDGVVTRVIDAHKVEVLFRDEAKTLAYGMT
ncbi:MAG TPA: hypothetical protein VGG39_35465 [Polyangiaceae bacterium]|jgi:hypothetical protein